MGGGILKKWVAVFCLNNTGSEGTSPSQEGALGEASQDRGSMSLGAKGRHPHDGVSRANSDDGDFGTVDETD